MAEELKPTSKGEQLLWDAIVSANDEVNPGAVLDPTMIMSLIGTIFEFISACRNRNNAESALASGNAISVRVARKALRYENYPGDIRRMARALAEKSKAAASTDRAAVIDDAGGMPVPPPSSGPWPLMIALAVLCLFANNASAGDGPWPSVAKDVTSIKATCETTAQDVADLNRKIEDMQSSIDRIANSLEPQGEPAPVPAKVTPKPAPAAKPIPTRVASSGVTFQGRPINVNEFIRQHPATTVEIRGDVVQHCRDHGFGGDLSSLSRSTLIKLHSAAHAMGVPARASVVRSAPVRAPAPMRSNCANGNCQYGSAVRYRTGLFGRVRPVYR